jgi:hypothetical protein
VRPGASGPRQIRGAAHEALLAGGPLGAAARGILRRDLPRLRSGGAFAQHGDPELTR